MVKELLLARHGAATSPDISAIDADRKLTPSGIQQVERLGHILGINGQKCQLLVHSPALRCRLTAEILGKYLKPANRMVIPSIYRAGRDELLAVINAFSNTSDHVLLVGHNPAISMIASYLTGEGHLMFSPGMMARLHFQDMGWDMLSGNTGTLEEILQ